VGRAAGDRDGDVAGGDNARNTDCVAARMLPLSVWVWCWGTVWCCGIIDKKEESEGRGFIADAIVADFCPSLMRI
jgi:hypothetical protein